jgi:hypothetical protein
MITEAEITIINLLVKLSPPVIGIHIKSNVTKRHNISEPTTSPGSLLAYSARLNNSSFNLKPC